MSLLNDVIADFESLIADLNAAVNALDSLAFGLDEMSMEASNLTDNLNSLVHTIEDTLDDYKSSQGPELPFEQSVGDDKPSQ